jgi:hypothetical protein
MVLEYDINRMVAVSEANQYDTRYYSYLVQRTKQFNTLICIVMGLIIINTLWTYAGLIKNIILFAIGIVVAYMVVHYMTTQSYISDKSMFDFSTKRWTFDRPVDPPPPKEYSIV